MPPSKRQRTGKSQPQQQRNDSASEASQSAHSHSGSRKRTRTTVAAHSSGDQQEQDEQSEHSDNESEATEDDDSEGIEQVLYFAHGSGNRNSMQVTLLHTQDCRVMNRPSEKARQAGEERSKQKVEEWLSAQGITLTGDAVRVPENAALSLESFSVPCCPGTLSTCYIGRISNEQSKDGSGVMYFHDGSMLKGSWSSDQVNGHAVYSCASGTRYEGSFLNGAMHGTINEYDSDTNALMFTGEYSENVKHGKGKLHLSDGGVFEGNWEHGEFHGTQQTYTYPPAMQQAVTLRGKWENGEMRSANCYVGNKLHSKQAYHFFESTDTLPSDTCMMPDPYEQLITYVQPSTICHSGEGLFAKIDLPGDVVVSFYNGIRYPGKITENRAWWFNSNAIALDEEADIDIDVPEPYCHLDSYVATIAHKANHSFTPNAKYDVFFHPRFGNIKCIRTLVPIKKDEEILVNYGYFNKNGGVSGPQWYRELWACELRDKKRQARNKRPATTDTQQPLSRFTRAAARRS